MELINNNNISQKKKILIGLLINLIIFLLIFSLFGFTYSINDDKTMMTILNGKYISPSNQSIFISQLVSYPLYLLYATVPNIPWYGIFFAFMNYIAINLIYFYFVKKSKEKKEFITSILIYLVVFFIFLFGTILSQQFTTNAAVTCAGLFCYILIFDKDWSKIKKIAFYLFLLIYSIFVCAIRVKVFLLFLPFVLLILIYKLLNKKQSLISIILCFLLLLSSYMGNVFIDKSKLGSKEYQDYQKYNAVRSDLFDYYDFPDYDTNKEIYDSLNISRNDYEMLLSYYLFIDAASYENLLALRDYQKQKDSEINFLYKIFDGGLEVIKASFGGKLVTMTLFYIFFLIFALKFTIRNKNKKDLVFLIFTILGLLFTGLLIAITMKLPNRVMYPIILFAAITSFDIINQNSILNLDIKKIKIKTISSKIFITMFSLLLLVNFGKDIGTNYYIKKNIYEKNQMIQEVKELDGFYIYDPYSIYKQNMFSFEKNYYEPNCLIAGDWICNSPWYFNLLEDRGINSITDALNNYNVYFIFKKDAVAINVVNEYLTINFNKQISFNKQMSNNFVSYKVINVL